MNRLDRALGILLHLRSGNRVSAQGLAQHFGVSRRTIYRDIETLSALGVPVYAERGREGGIRLLEGYFLPPVMFSKGEAVSLLLSLTLFHSLHSQPYPTDLETAEKKLLAAMPDTLRTVLTEAQKVIGFEGIPSDTFHPERAVPSQPVASTEQEESAESKTTTIFLQAVLERRTVSMHYRSPYRARTENISLEPFGVFWDRDHWYLVGKLLDQEQDIRVWRADRVLEITPRSQAITNHADFDVRSVLGRSWLKAAMQRWTQEALVRIRLSQQQAERLKKDWYYRHATFEQLSEHSILMTFGEDDQEVVLELLRWLGPGAELIEPMAWRVALRAGLAQMLAEYDDGKQNLS